MERNSTLLLLSRGAYARSRIYDIGGNNSHTRENGLSRLKYLNSILALVLFIGTVESVENQVAHVSVTASDNKIHQLDIPILLLPCKIDAQDMFYFLYVDDTIEIRCGEPPV